MALKALEVIISSTFDTEVEAALASANVADDAVRGFSTTTDANGITKAHIIYVETPLE